MSKNDVNSMIDSLLLVDDEDLFHLVFEDACSLLDITLSLESMTSADEAEKLFKKWFEENYPSLGGTMWWWWSA